MIYVKNLAEGSHSELGMSDYEQICVKNCTKTTDFNSKFHTPPGINSELCSWKKSKTQKVRKPKTQKPRNPKVLKRGHAEISILSHWQTLIFACSAGHGRDAALS